MKFTLTEPRPGAPMAIWLETDDLLPLCVGELSRDWRSNTWQLHYGSAAGLLKPHIVSALKSFAEEQIILIAVKERLR